MPHIAIQRKRWNGKNDRTDDKRKGDKTQTRASDYELMLKEKGTYRIPTATYPA